MRKFFSGLFLAAMIGAVATARAGVIDFPDVQLTSGDRVLILAPHPDDEILGTGGIIEKAVALKAPLKIVFLTYGDNNEWSFTVYRKHLVLAAANVRIMGLIRHQEAIDASKSLGLDDEHLTFLGYPDNGMLRIWNTHWGASPPYRSYLTKVSSVPYQNAYRPGAPYKGEDVLQDLTAILKEFRPTKIFVSHPADEMPDHRAYYLFLQVALWDIGEEKTPEIYPYLIHYRFRHWPRPLGFHPDQPLVPPATFVDKIPWVQSSLSKEEIDRKLVALKKHRTQFGYSGKYLSAFVRENELFGDFPPELLKESAGTVVLSEPEEKSSVETHDELTDEEKAKFVGLEKRTAHIEKGSFVMTIRYSRPLARETAISAFVYGYRKDRPFARMPKIRVQFGETAHRIFDQNARLKNSGIKVMRSAREVVIDIPLNVLGHPEKILTSARSYLTDVPLDWMSWRVLLLNDGN